MCMWICFVCVCIEFHKFDTLGHYPTVCHTILLKRAVRIMITPNQTAEKTHGAVKAHQDHLRSAERHCWIPVRGCDGLQ